MRGWHRRRRRQLGARPEARTRSRRGDRRQGSMTVRVGCLGMGWWSDVLADAIVRAGKMTIASCYSRTVDKKISFSKKYNCKAADSYEEMLGDKSIQAI